MLRDESETCLSRYRASRQGEPLMVERETEPPAGGPLGPDENGQRPPTPHPLALEDELALLRAVLRTSPDGVLFVDCATLRVLDANPALCRMLGYSLDELPGMESQRIVPQLAGVPAPARPGAAADGYETLAVVPTVFRTRDGATAPVECRVQRVTVSAKEYLVLVARAVGENTGEPAEKQPAQSGSVGGSGPAAEGPPAAEAASDPAQPCDALTGLPDRRLFETRLETALATARGRADYAFAVLFVDLDGFKAVNDTFGHLAGDGVLCEIAARLTRCIRPGDMVARFGGDEFTILVDDLRGPADAVGVAERIQSQLEKPAEVEGRPVTIAASIGIALSRESYRTPQQMIHDADRAMYRAKAGGKNHGAVFAVSEG